MTTVLDPNVFNIAVRGTSTTPRPSSRNCSTASPSAISTGWVRQLDQLGAGARPGGLLRLRLPQAAQPRLLHVDFSAHRQLRRHLRRLRGRRLLPPGSIHTLILATNANDLLTRFVTRGDYSRGEVIATSSPSMDIQIASNFERYLYYLRDEDGGAVRQDMDSFAATGHLDLSAFRERVARDFRSRSVSEAETIATIGGTASTATCSTRTPGGRVRSPGTGASGPTVVCLATAHPAVRRGRGRAPSARPPAARARRPGEPRAGVRCSMRIRQRSGSTSPATPCAEGLGRNHREGQDD